LVEHNLAKVGVAGSNPVVRSRNTGEARPVDEGMAIYENTISALDGSPLDLSAFKGKATLVVNVASKCGLTPQYEGLEKLHEQYKDRGFSVLGVPCNQFGQQEPGSSEEIATFCSTTYGVTFPLTEKVDVNGDNRHPLYQELTTTPDAEGQAGDIQWNFEKFLVSPAGDVVARFRPMVAPDADEVVSALESALPS
jgi:glutathione peroxidase